SSCNWELSHPPIYTIQRHTHEVLIHTYKRLCRYTLAIAKLRGQSKTSCKNAVFLDEIPQEQKNTLITKATL
ncbi:hypothetical protein, partial [uncultured Helicobacter sp.]|uniref:hypothetical protein n=1 Tax=uncultured Helicobacter sp. TaxID=175537 RepID=UPI002601E608